MRPRPPEAIYNFSDPSNSCMIVFWLLENKAKVASASVVECLCFTICTSSGITNPALNDTHKKKSTSMNIQIYYTLAQEDPTAHLTTWKKTSTKHTGSVKENYAEKYLQLLNIHYIQTRGLLGLSPWRQRRREEPSGPELHTCSGVSYLGVEEGVSRGLKCL